ncbi:MAG: hypothetical protein KA444_08890 [Bacteroidia bacterium]|nr:hypothetical protein [Bacteroidia bacterium]
MKSASLQEIKSAISTLEPARLKEVCVRLAKHKKENKELLSFLLFDNLDQDAFIRQVKEEMNLQFQAVNTSNLYLAKKSFRKILRITNKYIRFMANKETEADLLIYYCMELKNTGVRIQDSVVLTNLYNQQKKKIQAAVENLHEDLQFDFQKGMKSL